MITHAISTAVFTLVIAGVLFQVVTLTRLGARVVRDQARRHMRVTRRVQPTPPCKLAAPKRRRRRDYRLALQSGRGAEHAIAVTVNG